MTTSARKVPEDSLCEEHREFAPVIGLIERVGGAVGEVSVLTLRGDTATVHESLAHGLLPHAVGEGRTLFPVLRRVTGSDEAAVSMRREHVEIARLTDELERLRDELGGAGLTQAQQERIRRVLHGLETVVKEHFEQEEQMCFSVLQAELSPEEAREMFVTLRRVTEEIRSLYE